MTQATDLADEYFAYRQATEPHRLLYSGQLDGLANWEDLRSPAITERQESLRRFAARADAVALDASDDDRILLETVAFTANAAASGLTWRNEQTHVNPAFGVHTRLATFLGRFALSTAAHGDDYLRKLERLPTMLEQLEEEITTSAADGNVALARHLSASADAVEALVAADEQPLASQAAPTALSPADANAWRAEVDRIVSDRVLPALVDYGAALRELSSRGRSDAQAGICHLAGGDELYAELVWASTSLELTPEEIHEIGVDQIERLEAEYVEVAGPLVGATDISDIYAHLRDDGSMKYESGDDIVRDAAAALDRARAAAPGWFSSIPVSDCLANKVPTGPLAFYSAPDPDTGKPANFFFNTADPSAWSTYQLEAVTFHESIPGHHLQIGGFRESTTLHPVQTQFGITAYLEGWGLYTERLADEMGLYSSELSRVGMLSADSMRACRLVVDTGMHALGWSRAEAIDYVERHSPLSSTQIEGEIDRYIGMPGQALSYMIGRLEIDSIRAAAEASDSFEIAAFHDQVLGYGMVPLPTLRRIVAA
ncbi:MAG: DUF885 domain-containing protein [Ilumatobacteraceae bacterium]|nr:DUF885 domain-containing protein [Ilumatobacteraceae bacterium]